MGVVLQNSRVMSGSIFQNIAGVSQLTMDQAWDAARMAGLDADIQRMPMGMFTYLSDGASAHLRWPAPEVGDRASDRLQAAHPALRRSDQRPRQPHPGDRERTACSRLKATRIVIAHRLSTIINADRIYVLQAGRIVQSGTYVELMEREGPFRDLATRQIA